MIHIKLKSNDLENWEKVISDKYNLKNSREWNLYAFEWYRWMQICITAIFQRYHHPFHAFSHFFKYLEILWRNINRENVLLRYKNLIFHPLIFHFASSMCAPLKKLKRICESHLCETISSHYATLC